MGRWCLLSGAVVMALSAAASAEPPKRSWYSRLIPFRKADKPAADQARDKPAEAAKLSESPAARLAREKADWLRRSAVCAQLHDIALETNDEQLRRWAEDLDARAYQIYVKRSNGMTATGRFAPSSDTAAQRRPSNHSRAEEDRLSTGPRARGAGQD